MSSSRLGWRSMLRSLEHRNYRLYFIGQGVSLVGTWMQSLAMQWLVYRLTDSPFWLGVVGFSGQFPSFFMAPLAGVLCDRWNRHRTIVVTQTLSMLQAFVLAYLSWTGEIRVWHLIVLSVLLALIFAFDMTTRQAFLSQMVERKEDLANAIALNSMMVNAARLVGPTCAGILLTATGESVCFFLNGVSFLAVIVALLMMQVPAYEPPATSRRLVEGFAEGAVYAFGFPPIRAILLLMALVCFAGMPYTVLMPLFAGRPDTLSWLIGASGFGALTGAIYLASRRSVLGLGRVIAMAPIGFGLGLIGFALSRNIIMSMVLMFLVGFSMMVQMASSNTLLQTITDEDKRGRVMSFYTMAFMGTTPLGSLLAGVLADRIGAPQTLIIGGVCCMFGSLIFARSLPGLRVLIRPIYRRLGILPEVAQGIQAATELTTPPEER
jgi:MFS family permease